MKQIGGPAGSVIESDGVSSSGDCSVFAPELDYSHAQDIALRRLLSILNKPPCGDEYLDYLLRRNQADAARSLFQVRTRRMRDLAQDSGRTVAFQMPPLEHPDDAVQAQAATIRAVANGQLTPAEGSDVSKMITAWVQSLKATRLNPLKGPK